MGQVPMDDGVNAKAFAFAIVHFETDCGTAQHISHRLVCTFSFLTNNTFMPNIKIKHFHPRNSLSTKNLPTEYGVIDRQGRRVPQIWWLG